MSKVDLTISIVAYNSRNVLKGCIDSIINTVKGISYEIIVVDNSSVDGTAGFIKEHSLSVTLIENKQNVGFGRAHNQSFRVSRGRYFLILNPDAIVFPKAVNRMVKFMDNEKRAGVVGCKIFWDDDKNFMFPDLRIHSLKTALFQFTQFCLFFPNSAPSRWYWKSAYALWSAKKPIEVEGITGGLMLVRKEAFESTGMFDENFFLFFEEHDLLRRIRKAGWRIFYLPDAEIQHFFEESCRSCSFDIGKVFMQSALYYYKKHYKYAGICMIKLLTKSPLFERFLRKLSGTNNPDFTTINIDDSSSVNINWEHQEGAVGYFAEISYSPDFADRGGMFAQDRTLSLKSNILDRLPAGTGFIRIVPFYKNGSTGMTLKTLKITKGNRLT